MKAGVFLFWQASCGGVSGLLAYFLFGPRRKRIIDRRCAAVVYVVVRLFFVADFYGCVALFGWVCCCCSSQAGSAQLSSWFVCGLVDLGSVPASASRMEVSVREGDCLYLYTLDASRLFPSTLRLQAM